ncbi:glutathione S-transferase family protein [Corticibacter populi]|uniref:Glutathione S-transferase family protein n=1 Tax=Corticibacter populi TaxID=1550736 RepID=A0A3M6QS77_9BURK|nr:glutathione S-transferase family protein [Corticibacter populi]RMX05900.1 glutathione S-transferase family protein [Corticibacter populi]RZS30781.1 glutathione S-transferase [Corticibacter populi]
MTLKIYGIAASRAMRPLWAAHELNLRYEHIPLHFRSEQIKQPEYLSLNPNGTVPVIDDDGIVLFESLAITLHLARRHGQGTLWPEDMAQQAQALQWTLWAATEAEPPARQWFQHTSLLPAERRNDTLAVQGLATVRARLAVLEQQLQGRDYLLGPAFTVADLNVAAVLQRLPVFAGTDFPTARAWHARCFERPAALRTMAMRNQDV